MSRELKWNDNTIKRLIKEGRGSGEGANYLPWIRVQNISSNARSTRLKSVKTGRLHHLLSDIEYYLFLFLDWSIDVTDIREQFPLDRDITRALAMEMGIEHPIYTTSKIDTIMTTDFFITKGSGPDRKYVAINGKLSHDLNDFRVIEKLALQHAYHTGLGIEHYICTEQSIDITIGKNLERLWMAQPRPGEAMSREDFLEYEKRVLESLQHADPRQPLASFCTRYDSVTRCEPGLAYRIVKILMQKRILAAPLSNPNMDSISLTQLLSENHSPVKSA